MRVLNFFVIGMVLVSIFSLVSAAETSLDADLTVDAPSGEREGRFEERRGAVKERVDARLEEAQQRADERREEARQERLEKRIEKQEERQENRSELREERESARSELREERMKNREEFRAELRAQFKEEFMDAQREAFKEEFEMKMRNETAREAFKAEFREKLKEEREVRFEERNLSIRGLSNERTELIAGKINARTGLNLTAEDITNGTLGGLLRAELSNGRFAEVKVLPNRAAAIALHHMQATCAEENCSIELKEVGTGNTSRLAYVVETEQEGTFLFFTRKVAVRAEVDAETGAIIATHKPWWAVFVNEKEASSAEIEAETEISVEDAGATEDALAASSST